MYAYSTISQAFGYKVTKLALKSFKSSSRDLLFRSSPRFIVRRPCTSFSNLSILSVRLCSSDTKYCRISDVLLNADLNECRISFSTFLELSEVRVPVAIRMGEAGLFHLLCLKSSKSEGTTTRGRGDWPWKASEAFPFSASLSNPIRRLK